MLLSVPLAHAEWSRVVAGPVDRVAASNTHVAAVVGDRVWLFGDDGAVLGTLTADFPGRTVAARDAAAARNAEDILDRHDVSVFDRDSDWALELIEDERTLAQRHAAASARRPIRLPEHAPRPTVAASERALWVAAGRAAWQVDPHGRTRRIPLGAGQRMVAGSDTAILVATANDVTLLAANGAPLRTLALPTPVEHAALSGGNTHTAWSSGQAVEWLTAKQRHRVPAAAPVRQLVYCGDTLVMLTGDSVVALAPDGGAAASTFEPQARRWFCSADRARPWLAIARQLWVSVDQGQRWSAVPAPAGVMVTDAVATTHHVWLATTAGLFVSAAGGAESVAAAPAPRVARKRSKATAAWLSWLPTVSVQAMTRTTTGHREVEALALAQIPLEPRRLPVLHAAFEEAAVTSPATPTLRSHATVEARDPDRGCLTPARRKAVELAMAEPARAESYVARAGHAAWLPELRVLVSRRYGRSESLDLATSSTALSSPLGIDTVNDIRYEARATWDLGKLVFSAEELAAQNQALHMAELRRDLENTVNRLYFERRRLTVEAGGAEPWARQVRVREIEAELDALSAGAFGACIDPKP